LEDLAQYLDSSVYVFWTGPQILSATITLEDAETFKDVVKHKVILWENYPVNDGSVALHLEPIAGRDRNLYKVIDGYMSNPLFTENEINRIALFTMADYTYDPVDYDPRESIGQAIIHQTNNKAQQLVLLELVQLFSGEISTTSFNKVVDHFHEITASPYSRYLADLYLNYLLKVQQDLKNKFPAEYNATKQTLEETIRQVEGDYRDRYGTAFTATPVYKN
jgi:hypothetical protein